MKVAHLKVKMTANWNHRSHRKKYTRPCKVVDDEDCVPRDKILVDALVAKILNKQYPNSNKYNTVDFYNYHPQELAELYEQQGVAWYFFVRKDTIRIGYFETSINIKCKNGYWRSDYANFPIMSNRYCATKKSFVFHEQQGDGKGCIGGLYTDWVMREYRFDNYSEPEMDEWTLCELFQGNTFNQNEIRKRKRLQSEPETL